MKRRLFAAKNLSNRVPLTGVNELTEQFFLLQQRMQRREPKGRRFSLDDKVLALSLLKQSGKGYKFLSSIFALPSRKTLTTLLNKIPFGPGINIHIFEHLKNVVSNMKSYDRYCTLIFDEISLGLGLEYNRKLDGVEGFVDYGNSNRFSAFADHALVFMVRGIHRKWKQPVCFTFCEGTTSTAHLVRMLKNVIRQVRTTGLKIVATVCDQGATNRAAINQLLHETLVHNPNNRYCGFLIDDVEIVPLYDCPHLLKGIRNNLLVKKLQRIPHASLL